VCSRNHLRGDNRLFLFLWKGSPGAFDLVLPLNEYSNIHTYGYIYISIYKCVYVCIFLYTCMYIYMHTNIHKFMYICTHIYII